MSKSDEVRLRHMLDAARDALGFAAGKSRADLDSDRMLVLSLVKSIEIIGEAASKVTEETRRMHPSLPWLDIIGMRNRLIHAYYDVDLDRVWDTLAAEIPSLIAELESILKD
jgi:uncharacterized protein with HEPN domain